MDVSYLSSKRESITHQIRETEDEIGKVNNYLDELKKRHIYLQGSLATVGELLDYYSNTKGGNDEGG